MLDARIGEQALVVRLVENKNRRQQHRHQSEDKQDVAGKGGVARGLADLIGAQDGEKGAVEQHTGEERGDHRGGLAVGVGQPGVHRGEAHLGAVADQKKDEGDARQADIQLRPQAQQSVEQQGSLPSAGRGGGPEEKSAEEGEGDANRADEQIFPGGLEGMDGAVEKDQRRAGQGGRLDGHPQQAEMVREHNQGHGAEKEQYADDEDPLRIPDSLHHLRVRLREPALPVGGAEEKEERDDAEEEQAEGIDRQPAAQDRLRGLQRQAGHHPDMDQGADQPQAPAQTAVPDQPGRRAEENGKYDYRRDHC
ncbi:MAG: hypothetical protein BWY77_00618 [bacterium ADurb.Bin431]|nr:MAG: hypothetical protein BWY77_00618 [bacterium ADurb.Bin431]